MHTLVMKLSYFSCKVEIIEVFGIGGEVNIAEVITQ